MGGNKTIASLALAGFVAAMAWGGPALAEGSGRVVATLPALHSLAARLLDGVDEPVLLARTAPAATLGEMPAAGLEALDGAELVIWTGPELEPGLAQAGRVIAGLAPKSLSLTAAVPVLALSEAGDPDRATDNHDLRFWLDPRLANAAVGHLAPRLALLYPDRAEAVLDNEIRLHAELRTLERTMRGDLGTADGVPLHVGTSDLRYLEWRFNLERQGCARRGFDPMGFDLEPGAGLYARLMARAAETLKACRRDQVAEAAN